MLHGLLGPWPWDSKFNSNLLHQHSMLVVSGL